MFKPSSTSTRQSSILPDTSRPTKKLASKQRAHAPNAPGRSIAEVPKAQGATAPTMPSMPPHPTDAFTSLLEQTPRHLQDLECIADPHSAYSRLSRPLHIQLAELPTRAIAQAAHAAFERGGSPSGDYDRYLAHLKADEDAAKAEHNFLHKSSLEHQVVAAQFREAAPVRQFKALKESNDNLESEIDEAFKHWSNIYFPFGKSALSTLH